MDVAGRMLVKWHQVNQCCPAEKTDTQPEVDAFCFHMVAALQQQLRRLKRSTLAGGPAPALSSSIIIQAAAETPQQQGVHQSSSFSTSTTTPAPAPAATTHQNATGCLPAMALKYAAAPLR